MNRSSISISEADLMRIRAEQNTDPAGIYWIFALILLVCGAMTANAYYTGIMVDKDRIERAYNYALVTGYEDGQAMVISNKGARR